MRTRGSRERAGTQRSAAVRRCCAPVLGALVLLIAACRQNVEGRGGGSPGPALPDPQLSSVELTPAGPVVANGVDAVDVVVTVRDALGQALAGHEVQLAASGGGNLIVQPAGTTDAQGVAVGRLASTQAETKTVSALVDPGPAAVALAQAPAVDFLGDAGAISPSLSSVIAAPATHVAADGVETAQVVVTVRDVNGNPVPGRIVELAANGTASVLVQPAGPTDASGVATGALASFAAEIKALSATVDPGPGAIALDDGPTVAFAWVEPLTRFVRQSGTDPPGCTGGTTPATAWRTLSKAAACAPPGATIHVGAGVYAESVRLATGGSVAAPLRLVADVSGEHTGDAGEVVLDAQGAATGLHLDGTGWVVVEGLTVRGAGEGLRLEGASDVTLRDCVVYGCSTGVRALGGARLAIEHARVSNAVGAPGRGVVVEGASELTLLDTLVYNNPGEGILALAGATNLLVRACTLYANGGDQVAVAGAGASLTVRDSLVVLGGQDGLQGAPGSTIVGEFDDVWGHAGLDWNGVVPGPGNLALDPQVVDPAGPDGLLGGADGGDDDFHLSVALSSPAFDAGSGPAAGAVGADTLSLALRTSRTDGVLDGSAPDGATLNLGYHYAVMGDALVPLVDWDVRAVYGEGVSLRARARTWDAGAGSWSAEVAAPPTQAPVRWARLAQSPLQSDEQVLGLLAGTGSGSRLDVLAWSGATWQRLFASTALAPALLDRRGFDLAYEAASGDLLVVYSVDDATPVFRARSGGAWSAEQPLPLNDGAGPLPDTNTGVVQWVQLAARPGGDDVALAFSDANADLVVLDWDGEQWSPATAATPCVDLTQLAGAVRNRCFDLAWEDNSGDLLVAWGRNAIPGFWWAERPAGGALGPVAQVASAPGYAPNVIDLAAEPDSDRIALAAYDLDARERFGLATWDGATWLHAGEYDSVTGGMANTGLGDLSAGIAWLGTSGVAICVYPDVAPGRIDWARWTAAGGWVVQPDVAVAGKGRTDSVELVAGPACVTALVSDDAGRLFGALYDGLGWSVTTPALEVALASSASVPFSAAARD